MSASASVPSLTPEDVQRVVGDTPHMTLEQARRMTAFILEHDTRDILELGFAHGVSTCYMAAALQRKGGGSIVAIDLEVARALQPSVEELLTACRCRHLATCYYEPTSYTWRLMKMIESPEPPRFDLCYIDGAHTWDTDGFAFFLVDRLLRPGGWLIFDDLKWSFSTSPRLRDLDWVKGMPDDERNAAQVGKVFELLVKRHPAYGDLRAVGGWGYARKLPAAEGLPPLRREFVGLAEVVSWLRNTSLGAWLRRLRR